MRNYKAENHSDTTKSAFEDEILDLSIIIANYNNSNYLKKAIDSVLEQDTTYSYEIIIIDDCSTDNSIDVIAEYDDGLIVKIYNNLNVGISSVRNIGIERAKGKFISFLDSDDYYHPKFIDTMLTHINDNDVIICNYKAITKDDEELEVFRENKSSIYTSGLLKNENSAVVWNKVFKRETIMDCRFLDGVKNEDILFNICVSTRTDKIKFVDDALVHYRQLSTSITKSFDLTIIKDMGLVLDKIKNECGEEYKNDFYECYTYYYLIIGFKRWIKCSGSFKDYLWFVKSIDNKRVQVVKTLLSRKYSSKQKLVVTLLYLSKVIVS